MKPAAHVMRLKLHGFLPRLDGNMTAPVEYISAANNKCTCSYASVLSIAISTGNCIRCGMLQAPSWPQQVVAGQHVVVVENRCVAVNCLP